MRAMKTAALAMAAVVGLAGNALAAGEAPVPPAQDWSFNGIFGTFDRAAMQRGLQVYMEVCAGCHSMDLLAYRNLTDLGFSEAEVTAIAAQYRVADGPDDTGEMFERPGRPADTFVAPYANEQAARAANNGALPPDLSVITKARGGGPDYIYGLLTGYEEPPPGVQLMAGMHYNEYFPGHQIAMPNMLSPGLVEFADGTEATTEQMAWDVVTFLTWAAEPHMETRKEMGVQVILFLIVFTGLMYAVKRRLWADVH